MNNKSLETTKGSSSHAIYHPTSTPPNVIIHPSIHPSLATSQPKNYMFHNGGVFSF
jgi:hypothetical protein